MKHLGPEMGQLLRFVVTDDRDYARFWNLPRIGTQDPRHIGPDLDFSCIQRRTKQSRAVVRTAATEGSRPPIGSATNKPGHDDGPTGVQMRSNSRRRLNPGHVRYWVAHCRIDHRSRCTVSAKT